jgi:DNA-binding transcriptional MerR regulator
MANRLTIGQFAQMTYLSATTLRHYHAVGVLEPAAIDPATGYRYYTTDQIADAHVVRRLRGLEMPIDDVRSVLQADDPDARNAIIATHLGQMERRLRETAAAVASLRELLSAPVDVLAIRYRTVAPTPAWTIAATVGLDEIDAWAPAALHELVHGVRSAQRTGPPGVLYDPAFFSAGRGPVMAFVPTERSDRPAGRVRAAELPAAELAIGLHRGRLGDLDRSYGAVGRVVAEQGITTDGAIREHFLGRDPQADDPEVQLVEVAWPVDRTGAAA